MKNNLKTKPLTIEIVNRWRWEVVAPVSSVRIGETRRDHVKSKHRVDYPRWVALFVGRSEAECKRWLDKHKTVVLKLCIPYEVF